jgi:AraC family transcriptional regulator, exoenzyme S synthesis regulatory protein ExsA
MLLEHKRFDLYNKMIFEKVLLKPPFKVPNSMPNEACFLYVCEGGQRLSSAVQQEQLKARDAVLMKCGMYFGDWISSADYHQCEAIAVHLYPEVLRKIYESEIPDFIKNYKVVNQVSMYKVTDNILIDQYIISMQFYFENPHLVDADLIKLKLKELILLLMKTEKAKSVMEVIASLFSPIEHSIKEIIEANVFSNHSVEELAQLANLSVSSFKREFTKIYNDSPAHYLKNRKLEKAAELLWASDLRISEIAMDCGFNDLSHFSKSFQEKYNMSPTEYRLSQNAKSLNQT